MSDFATPYSEIASSPERREDAANQLSSLADDPKVRSLAEERNFRGFIGRNRTPALAHEGILRAVTDQAAVLSPFLLNAHDDRERIIGVAAMMKYLSLTKIHKRWMPVRIAKTIGWCHNMSPAGSHFFAWAHPDYEEEFADSYAFLSRRLLAQASADNTQRGIQNGADADEAKAWTLEPTNSPQFVHDAIWNGRLFGAGAWYYDDGEALGMETAPQSILYKSDRLELA